MIRSDNGGKYDAVAFNKYFRDNGIQHQLTAPYTPQLNGVSERMKTSLIGKATCLLIDGELPKCFWAEAIHMAVYIMNRSICSVLKDKTLDGIFYGMKL